MGETRGADTAPIWPIGPVTVEVKEEAFDTSQMPALARLTKPNKRPFLLWVLR